MLKKVYKSELKGEIIARPSKSFAHRYLIASALSDTESTISNVDFSNDIIATLNCIHAYGKSHYRDFEKNEVIFKNNSSKNFFPTFDCQESGTTLRIFFPIAIQKYNKANFIGTDRLIERGIDIYEKIFKYVSFTKDKYSIKTNGLLNEGQYELPGNISSQYISGLLYALPLLKNDSKIIINTKLESKNYILMTLQVLNKYGINIQSNNNIFNSLDEKSYLNSSNDLDFNTNLVFLVPGNQKYIANNNSIEGDYSNAAFIDAFNYFGNKIVLKGLNPDSLQSDKIYKKNFDKLESGFAEIDISNCIDLGPILITFAALKNGAKFINTSRLKIKESDRGKAIAEELAKCNADISILDNEIIVKKNKLNRPKEALNSHNDHRIAMSLSLLSTLFDVEIDGAECVSKSYPGYFDDLKKLGMHVE